MDGPMDGWNGWADQMDGITYKWLMEEGPDEDRESRHANRHANKHATNTLPRATWN